MVPTLGKKKEKNEGGCSLGQRYYSGSEENEKKVTSNEPREDKNESLVDGEMRTHHAKCEKKTS